MEIGPTLSFQRDGVYGHLVRASTTLCVAPGRFDAEGFYEYYSSRRPSIPWAAGVLG